MTTFNVATHDDFYDNHTIVRDDESKLVKYLNRHTFWFNSNPPDIYFVYSSIQEEYQQAWYDENTSGFETTVITTPIAACEIWYHDNVWCICNMSVRTDHQNQGIATQMIDEVIKFLKSKNVNKIKRTRASTDGEKYTKDKISNTLNAAGINFYWDY